jgi:hypothetical protein
VLFLHNPRAREAGGGEGGCVTLLGQFDFELLPSLGGYHPGDTIRHLTAAFEELADVARKAGAPESLCNAFKVEVLPSLKLGYWGNDLRIAIGKHYAALRTSILAKDHNGR